MKIIRKIESSPIGKISQVDFSYMNQPSYRNKPVTAIADNAFKGNGRKLRKRDPPEHGKINESTVSQSWLCFFSLA